MSKKSFNLVERGGLAGLRVKSDGVQIEWKDLEKAYDAFSGASPATKGLLVAGAALIGAAAIFKRK